MKKSYKKNQKVSSKRKARNSKLLREVKTPKRDYNAPR
jgi:hypothetical protein